MIRLFDSASYIGRFPSGDSAHLDASSLLTSMDRLGIERALVNHTLSWQYSPAEGNQVLLEAISGQPRLEACWGISPGSLVDKYGGAEDLETVLLEQKVRAVRVYPRDHVYPLTDWMVDDLFSLLEQRRMVVFMDLDQVFMQVGMYDYDPNGLRHLDWVCRTYPNLSIVLSRVGYRAYQNLLALVRRHTNLYMDLSYFATHQGVEDIVNKFGASRLIFGTSQPLVDPGGALARLQYADLPHGQKEAIGWHNLESMLNRVITIQPEAQKPHFEVPVQVSEMEIIDAHGHLGPYFKFSIPDSDSQGLVRVMDACGVKMAAISSHLAVSGDWHRGNQITLKAVQEFPDRLIGQVVVSPNEPELIRDELTRYIDDLAFRAIKIVPDTHRQPVLAKGYEPVWEFAAERQCLVLSHTFHGSSFDDPGLFRSIAERYPGLPILIVHSGALTAAFEKAIRLAQEYPNLYLDISGSYITGSWIKRMVDILGAERVVFSSDLPFIDQRYSLGRVLYAGLTTYQMHLVLAGNARKLFKLNPNN